MLELLEKNKDEIVELQRGDIELWTFVMLIGKALVKYNWENKLHFCCITEWGFPVWLVCM